MIETLSTELKVVGLDVATNMGWAYWNGKKVQSGAWDLSCARDESRDIRLWNFVVELDKLREQGIDLIVFEAVRNLGFNKKGGFSTATGVIVQSELQGVLKNYCMAHQIPYKGYSPSEIKKFATGKGNANKEDMIRVANERFGRNVKSDDEADAVCLLYLAESVYGKVRTDLLRITSEQEAT